jgi:hypothetical protein
VPWLLKMKRLCYLNIEATGITKVAQGRLTALAIGLFGIGILAAGPLAEVHAMLPRATGKGGCSTSTGGCGGGCGGGGCGGGGCGGCGGG